MFVTTLRRMPKPTHSALRRSQVIAQHLMSTQAPQSTSTEDPVIFESNASSRVFSLNRPPKHNALNDEMLDLLLPKLTEWNKSDLCKTIVGQGVGRSFCAGGDVASVVGNAANEGTRQKAIDFFKREFELDYYLAGLTKPYVVVMDGHTMGGGVGLAAPAQFRIATENTNFAMPETKIGYYPDVGASFFMSRLDGELGTYLALTGDTVQGRAVFELGFATHFIPARRVPVLLNRLAALEDPHPDLLNTTIEELSSEYQPEEKPSPLSGSVRVAIDTVFKHDTVEKIINDLELATKHASRSVSEWATKTLGLLRERSPTSLKVSLEAIRRGKQLSLQEAFNMELRLSTAYCMNASPDFKTGVTALLIARSEGRPEWSPSTLEEVSDQDVREKFFSEKSPFTTGAPQLTGVSDPSSPRPNPTQYALPTEAEIRSVISGSHRSGGSTGLTLAELVAKFDDLRGGKLGVKQKIEEVVSRQCTVVDNKDGNFVWLKWQPTQLAAVSD